MHLRTGIIRQSGYVLIVLATVLSMGCVHESFGLKMEPRATARELGFPQCWVSPPMSQEAVLAHARIVGNPHLESQTEWGEIVHMAKKGGELRLVDCLGKKQGPTAGAFFYGLFRGNRVIAKIYPMIIN